MACIRDDGNDTDIVIRSLDTGAEEVVATDAIDLDPRFGPDGTSLCYTSADSGSIDLWRLDLNTGTSSRLTREQQLENHAQE